MKLEKHHQRDRLTTLEVAAAVINDVVGEMPYSERRKFHESIDMRTLSWQLERRERQRRLEILKAIQLIIEREEAMAEEEAFEDITTRETRH